MITLRLMDMLYRHFGIVAEINDGKLVNLHVER